MKELYNLVLGNMECIVQVQIERKKMRTCRLKVYPNRIVIISVPKSTSSKWVYDYLDSKREWISEKLLEFEQREVHTPIKEVRDGAVIRYLGNEIEVSVVKSPKNLVWSDERSIIIFTPDVENQEKIIKQFDKWWKSEADKILSAHLDKLYPIIEKHGIPKPTFNLRKMKTQWGSCSYTKGKVTFNQFLIKAKPEEVEYVVLHELAHFLHPNHSKMFYSFLGSCLPDWKERRNALNKNPVYGF